MEWVKPNSDGSLNADPAVGGSEKVSDHEAGDRRTTGLKESTLHAKLCVQKRRRRCKKLKFFFLRNKKLRFGCGTLKGPRSSALKD